MRPAVEHYVELAASATEAAGVLMIVVGALLTFVQSLRVLQAQTLRRGYETFREGLGRSLLLGLELLVAADVIETVSTTPDLSQVGGLGLIVVIRTFLSWSLEVELHGRWPWKASR